MALILTGSFHPGRLCRGGLAPRGYDLWAGLELVRSVGAAVWWGQSHLLSVRPPVFFWQCVCEKGEGGRNALSWAEERHFLLVCPPLLGPDPSLLQVTSFLWV